MCLLCAVFYHSSNNNNCNDEIFKFSLLLFYTKENRLMISHGIVAVAAAYFFSCMLFKTAKYEYDDFMICDEKK
jgi:hypothetical protein